MNTKQEDYIKCGTQFSKSNLNFQKMFTLMKEGKTVVYIEKDCEAYYLKAEKIPKKKGKLVFWIDEHPECYKVCP